MQERKKAHGTFPLHMGGNFQQHSWPAEHLAAVPKAL